MRGEQLPEHIRDLLYAEDHGLLDDQLGCAVRRTFLLGIADSFTRGVHRDKIRQAFAGPFRIPKLSQGDFIIGFAVHAQEPPTTASLPQPVLQ